MVCLSTTARAGPGDTAPSKQIETTVSQIVIVMVRQFAPMTVRMHLRKRHNHWEVLEVTPGHKLPGRLQRRWVLLVVWSQDWGKQEKKRMEVALLLLDLLEWRLFCDLGIGVFGINMLKRMANLHLINFFRR